MIVQGVRAGSGKNNFIVSDSSVICKRRPFAKSVGPTILSSSAALGISTAVGQPVRRCKQNNRIREVGRRARTLRSLIRQGAVNGNSITLFGLHSATLYGSSFVSLLPGHMRTLHTITSASLRGDAKCDRGRANPQVLSIALWPVKFGNERSLLHCLRRLRRTPWCNICWLAGKTRRLDDNISVARPRRCSALSRPIFGCGLLGIL